MAYKAAGLCHPVRVGGVHRRAPGKRMADPNPSSLPTVTPEQRRICAAQFERANQVIASGNYDYGIQLLISCCKLDPANIIYRQTLRRTEKTKFRNNLRGSRFAWLTTSAARARIKAAKRGRNYVKVLEHGEEVLARNQIGR